MTRQRHSYTHQNKLTYTRGIGHLRGTSCAEEIGCIFSNGSYKKLIGGRVAVWWCFYSLAAATGKDEVNSETNLEVKGLHPAKYPHWPGDPLSCDK
jgi:hypothetical protein